VIMAAKKNKMKIGIVGCGAIGSRIAYSIGHELKHVCRLSGLYDIDQQKAYALQKKLSLKGVVKQSLTDLLKDCDCMVEAVNAKDTHPMIEEALQRQRHVLAMSVGKLLKSQDLFKLARKNRRALLIPSGAIAGIDAIKSASLVGIKKITLTTRKPPQGFKDNPYLRKKKINLRNIRKETVLFEGHVNQAVRFFPQNINVAATLALASFAGNKLLIRILTSPRYKINSHQVELSGPFGRIQTQTDNVVCPDNPKTSYLAVLSGIQTLKQFCSGIYMGT